MVWFFVSLCGTLWVNIKSLLRIDCGRFPMRQCVCAVKCRLVLPLAACGLISWEPKCRWVYCDSMCTVCMCLCELCVKSDCGSLFPSDRTADGHRDGRRCSVTVVTVCLLRLWPDEPVSVTFAWLYLKSSHQVLCAKGWLFLQNNNLNILPEAIFLRDRFMFHNIDYFLVMH